MARRTLLLVLVPALVAGAGCSGAGPSAAAAEGACRWIDVEPLSEVLGADLDEANGTDTMCTLSASERATTVGLSLTDLRAAPPAEALDLLRDTCDEGTVADLEIRGAVGGAFGCLVDDEPTVVGASRRHVGVVAGVSVDPEVPDDDLVRTFAAAVGAALAKAKT